MNTLVEWRDIPSLPGYQASSDGQIKGPSGRILSQRRAYKGRLVVNTSRAGDHKVHQLVCEAFHGPKPSPRHHVAHRDGDKDNNTEENLRWATPEQNLADAERLGEYKIRTRKLSLDIARKIRGDHASGEYTNGQLAEKYGTTWDRISLVINNRIWVEPDCDN